MVKAEQEASPVADASSRRASGRSAFQVVPLRGHANLFAGLTFRRLRQLMNRLPEDWIAVGAVVGGLPAGLALGCFGDDGQAELMSLFVVPGERRRGIAKQLLENWTSDALARGATSIYGRFVEQGQRHTALVALLAGAGWTIPVEEGLFVLGTAGTMVEAVGNWAPVSQKLTKQSVYTFDPLHLTEADRQRIDGLLALSDARHMQGPLRLWQRLEPAVSCIVRREGELVGWVLAGPATGRWDALTGTDAADGAPRDPLIEYFEAYLDPSYWHTAVAVGAYYHCYRKQVEIFGSRSLALYYTNSSRPRMVHLTRRRFAPIADRVETIFRSDGPSSETPRPS